MKIMEHWRKKKKDILYGKTKLKKQMNEFLDQGQRDFMHLVLSNFEQVSVTENKKKKKNMICHLKKGKTTKIKRTKEKQLFIFFH